MAGRIRDEDIALVRERAPIADIIGEHVQLRNAGGGNLKGICPFHDEKSPSFSVSPSRGLFHCFGCGVGGDVIRFIERIEHLNFTEAVERLAAQVNVQLRYVEGGSAPSRPQGQRARLIQAHQLAAKFYAEQLRSNEGKVARDFLTERGFDESAAELFGCGFAPAGWDPLTKHLQAAGFSSAELVTAGLAHESRRGTLIDQFRRRLLWPIRDVSGEVVGFGARRLFDDDPLEAKYLNTKETPIYKKNQMLYGMDLAKKEVARQNRAVIVEGYSDVMACHLAGVTTAVATCGTAFGAEHISLLRRLMMDGDAFRGEMIFTFDGDSAGRKAAERAFADDQKFMSYTFVAIEPNGLDPCELRQKSGDAAVRDLVARRVPLVQFVLKSSVDRFDLETAEGRSAALDVGVPLVAQIKDQSLRVDYSQVLARMVGIDDPDRVLSRVRGMARGGRQSPERPTRAQPPVDDAVASVEREVLKVAMQLPAVAGPSFDALVEDAFLLPAHRQLRAAVAAAGGSANAVTGAAWAERVSENLPDEPSRALVHALAVEPLHAGADSQERYADAVIARLHEIVLARQIAVLKSRLQRTNPIEAAEEHARMFGELIALESQRRTMRDRAIGSI